MAGSPADRRFVLPDLGEGLTEAQIVAWLVAPGDTVRVDQPVVEVESAKSVVELPCPFGGVVTRLGGEPGQTLTSGDLLVSVRATDAAVPDDHEPRDAPAPSEAVPSGSGAVLVGYGTVERPPEPDTAPQARFGSRIADRLRPPDLPTLSTGTGSPPGFPGTPPDLRTPITGQRRAAVDRLSTSRREVADATLWLDVDATGLFQAQAALATATGEHFGLTALIARFVVAGLRRYPQLNASVDLTAGEIVQHGAVNLGLAAQTGRGLMVPVVHGAHALTLRELRDAVAGIVAQTPAGHFTPDQLSGGTFTLNNFGSLGVDGSAAIINYPEAAMLGIGRMIERPWVVHHALTVRTVVELSLVFDHRVCDGAVAAGFLTFVARCIHTPIGLFAEL